MPEQKLLDVWFKTLDLWLQPCRASVQPLEGGASKHRRRFKKPVEARRYVEADSWDGSIDNCEKLLEEHVGRYGELF
jgi:hypothetical protein